METRIGNVKLLLLKGDVTLQATDAIVNAANSSLMGGGGVDGAIHRAGGPAILEECRRIIERQGRLPAGKAVITTGGNLKAKHVIHTVGPVWHGGSRGESELLASAYTESLKVAVENGIRTVAFPSISTGAYGYPVDRAAQVAIGAVISFLRDNPGILEEVRFVLYSDDALASYEAALQSLLSTPGQPGMHQGRSRRIKIKAGDVTAVAELKATRTADAVWNALPLAASASTWGDEVYFPIPVQGQLEDGREVVEVGDLGYWPPGHAFCIFFGPTPISRGDEIRPASAVSVFGKIVGDPTAFRRVRDGDAVALEKESE